MRTNDVLDEALLAQAKSLTGLRTTRTVIDEALRVLVQSRQQAQAGELRGRLQWECDLDALREGRALYDTAAGEPAA